MPGSVAAWPTTWASARPCRSSPSISTALAAGRGPTLVVCPTSLLGNWEREVRRFAPATVVRRHHGPGRSLAELAAGRARRHELRRGPNGCRDALDRRLQPGGRRRGPARQEPRDGDRPGAAHHRRPCPARPDRHPGGEPAERAVVDPRLDDARICSARSSGSCAPSRRPSSATATRWSPSGSPARSARSCSGGGRADPGVAPDLPPRTSPTCRSR